MDKMIDFFRYDYIAMLGLVVLIASLFLFILIIKSLSRTSRKTTTGAEDEDEEMPAGETSEDEMSLLETYLRSISDDLTEIKQRLATIENKSTREIPADEILNSLKDKIETQVMEIASTSGSADPAKLNKDLQEIKLRLSAIHKIISNLAEQ